MPLEIIRNDITKVHADAIVNAANASLLGGGGVDGAIHQAAGEELLEYCRSLGGCEVGKAKITKGYKLPAKYVIHTVGPKWEGDEKAQEKLLADCYINSLALAKEYNLTSVAFPLISTGTYGYPKDLALNIAISTIGDFLLTNDMTVFLIVYDRASFKLSEKLFQSITQFVDDRYIEEHHILRRNRLEEMNDSRESYKKIPDEFTEDEVQSIEIIEGLEAHIEFFEDAEAPNDIIEELEVSKKFFHKSEEPIKFHKQESIPFQKHKRNLEDLIKYTDETFSQMLLRLIDEKGMTDAQTYKKANIDRKLFSKIRNDINYRPSKPTALAFAIALMLNLDETRDLLLKAGFALSHSSKFDLIIEYFIEEGNYNIFEINEALFAFDQNLLGI